MTTRDELVEAVARKVHGAYLETANKLGHLIRREMDVSFDLLSDDAKELDRATARAAIAIVVERCAKISGDIEARGPGIGHERYPITRAINALAGPRE